MLHLDVAIDSIIADISIKDILSIMSIMIIMNIMNMNQSVIISLNGKHHDINTMTVTKRINRIS